MTTVRGKDQPLIHAPVLDQLEGQWQKIAAVLVWKLAREKGVIVGDKDFEEIRRANADGQVFMTWGHYDSFEFRWMDRGAALKLAEHVKGIGGEAHEQ
jgi:hypothetical protein